MTEWDSMKTLDRYVHDYMVKKEMKRTAEIFATEACIASTEVAIDHPDGFLAEWWSIFWDVFKFRLQNHHQGNDQEGGGGSPPIPTDPLVFGNILQNLFSTIPKPDELNEEQVMFVKQNSCSIPNMAMNHPSSSSIPSSMPAMIVRIPPAATSTISMNNHYPIPPIMGVMQPPSSIISSVIHQQMLAQIPKEMHEEPVSILLAKMYEQECLRRSARELAAKVQPLDSVKINPILESSTRSSRHLPWQTADNNNIQQWVVGREDECPMNLERSSNALVSTSPEASEAEIPDAEQANLSSAIEENPD